MNVKKKLFSFSKRLCILSLCVVIGLAVSLQGFCASIKHYIDFKPFVLSTAQVFSNTVGPVTPSVSCSSSNGIDNYFNMNISSSSSSSKLRISFSQFFTGLSVDSTYTYHLVFGLNGSDSVYNCAGTSTLYFDSLNNPIVTASKRYWDTNNHNAYYFFDFNISSESGDKALILEIPFSNTEFITSSFQLKLNCVGVGYSYYTSVSGTDKLIEQFGSNYSKPNTSDVDNYNKAESQLYNDVQGSLDNITSQWNNIGNSLLQYQGAFLAVGKFFNNLTNIGWIKVVLILSIAIGMFALLLGAVLDYAKGTQIRNERENWKAETRKYRESMKNRKGRGK